MIPCFLLEPNGQTRRYLRRFGADGLTPESHYHAAMTHVDDVQGPASTAVWSPENAATFRWPLDDPRWPTTCATCPYAFTADDPYQAFAQPVYCVVAANEGSALALGSLTTLRDAPPGAMYHATWLEELEGPRWWKGPDGRVLYVITPGGEWSPDSRASNCGSPDDDEHRCWVRHGIPPNVTVDKNGVTCSAGAGSIGQPGYHGFLRDGHLTNA